MNPNEPMYCERCDTERATVQNCDIGMQIKCECGRLVHAANIFQVVRAWFGIDGVKEVKA